MAVELTPRQSMNFAAGLDDLNPWYFDDTRPEGTVAPPMLAVALTWPLSSGLHDGWGEGIFTPEVLARQVHYNESIVWHRTMQPDERLEITGRMVAISPHRAGALTVIRYDASDRSGALVFTEHITGLLRGVTLLDAGSTVEDLPCSSPLAPVLEGAWSKPLAIHPLAAHVYDACSEISFPIHTSAAFAKQVGLPGAIYHGTATLGLALREILNREGGGDPRGLAEVHSGFRALVYPGSTVELRILGVALESAGKTVYFEVRTAAGELAVRDGRAVLRFIQ